MSMSYLEVQKLQKRIKASAWIELVVCLCTCTPRVCSMQIVATQLKNSYAVMCMLYFLRYRVGLGPSQCILQYFKKNIIMSPFTLACTCYIGYLQWFRFRKTVGNRIFYTFTAYTQQYFYSLKDLSAQTLKAKTT